LTNCLKVCYNQKIMTNKENFAFGEGSFVTEVMLDDGFFNAPIREQALAMGWADGCPVALDLTDPENQQPGRGPEAMLARYAEVNFWFTQITREVEEVNPELYDQLMSMVDRIPGEEAGLFEEASVPSDYKEKMYPMNTIAGFALPRVLVDYLKDGEPGMPAAQDRLIKVTDLVQEAAKKAEDPLDLLVIFAGKGFDEGMFKPEKVFKHILGSGWVAEHNSMSTIAKLKSRLQEDAPSLWAEYCKLSDDDKKEMKIL